MTPASIKQFLLAGRAVFTVDNGSGRHYTFRIGKGDDPAPGSRFDKAPYFASVLEGGESFAYMGMLNERTGEIRRTPKSAVPDTAQSWIALTWALRRIWAGKLLPEPAVLLHAGACCRCGRELTDTLSIQSGWGPDCAKLAGVNRESLIWRSRDESRSEGHSGEHVGADSGERDEPGSGGAAGGHRAEAPARTGEPDADQSGDEGGDH